MKKAARLAALSFGPSTLFHKALAVWTPQAPLNGCAPPSLVVTNRRRASLRRRERLHLALYEIDRRGMTSADCELADYARHFLMPWRNFARSIYLITNTDCFA